MGVEKRRILKWGLKRKDEDWVHVAEDTIARFLYLYCSLFNNLTEEKS
jgi:hypothetical protein